MRFFVDSLRVTCDIESVERESPRTRERKETMTRTAKTAYSENAAKIATALDALHKRYE